jgi:hypothetical protein
MVLFFFCFSKTAFFILSKKVLSHENRLKNAFVSHFEN